MAPILLNPAMLDDSASLEDLTMLCLYLGGDITSFTGDLFRLIAKADPDNRWRIRQGFPVHVAAWEHWNRLSGDDLRVGVLTETLTDDPRVRHLVAT